jgi:hypothetical protein
MDTHLPNPVPLEVKEIDGGLYVTSRDIPGFHLFSRNPIDLIDDIPEMAKYMLRHNRQINARVTLIPPGKARPENNDQAKIFLTTEPRLRILF